MRERQWLTGDAGGVGGCAPNTKASHPERATFAGVELMHVARHAGPHHRRRDRVCIEKRAIDDRAGCVHVATNVGLVHAGTLALC